MCTLLGWPGGFRLTYLGIFDNPFAERVQRDRTCHFAKWLAKQDYVRAVSSWMADVREYSTYCVVRGCN